MTLVPVSVQCQMRAMSRMNWLLTLEIRIPARNDFLQHYMLSDAIY